MEIEEWLTTVVDRIRERAPYSACRLLRLTQAAPTRELEIGWLIELDAGAGDPPLDEDGLMTLLGEMRLLGLQPTLLTHGEGVLNGNGRPAARSRAASDQLVAPDRYD